MALSQAVTYSGQQRRDIEHVLVQRWPNIETTQNVTCLLGGAHGANRSVTIQLDEG